MLLHQMRPIERVKSFYGRLSLQKKCFLVFDLFVLIVGLTSFILLQFSTNTYNKQLVDNSSHLLDLYSANIENELLKVDQLTLTCLSNASVQTNLFVINDNSTQAYEKAQAFNQISSYLSGQAQTARYISSITVVSQSKDSRTAGNSVIDLDTSMLDAVDARLQGSNGSIVWMGAQKGDRDVIAARRIRDLNNLKEIGTLIVRLDPNTLVRQFTVSQLYNIKLAIISDQKQFIYLSANLSQKDFSSLLIPKTSSFVSKIQGKEYLINRVTSTYTNWTYLYLLPYHQIFENTLFIHTLSVLVLAILLVVVNVFGFFFANSISKPLRRLSSKMKIVQSGQFNVEGMSQVANENCDEVGQLNNDFILMVEKINDLIKENYIKQILAKESQLKALQAQINPHFLYNTLDSIHWIAKANREPKIARMIQALANLLRSSISTREDFITLEQELHLLDDYFMIQKIRFEDRLRFRLHIDDSLLHQLIPRLTLQPIIENSIKHSLEKMTRPCTIDVSAERSQDLLILTVRDDGVGISETRLSEIQRRGDAHTQSIGLANIKERIELYYGDGYGLEIASVAGQGTCVTIRLPFQT